MKCAGICDSFLLAARPVIFSGQAHQPQLSPDIAYPAENELLSQYEDVSRRIASQLERGPEPALRRAVASCSVLRVGGFEVVSAGCIVERFQDM